MQMNTTQLNKEKPMTINIGSQLSNN